MVLLPRGLISEPLLYRQHTIVHCAMHTVVYQYELLVKPTCGNSHLGPFTDKTTIILLYHVVLFVTPSIQPKCFTPETNCNVFTSCTRPVVRPRNSACKESVFNRSRKSGPVTICYIMA